MIDPISSDILECALLQVTPGDLQQAVMAQQQAPGTDSSSTLRDVPFVLLVCDRPELFAAELLHGCCQRLLQLAAQHHPGCSLGIWMHSFQQWCHKEEVRNGRAGRTDFCASRMKRLLAQLAMTCPGVQLKDVRGAAG